LKHFIIALLTLAFAIQSNSALAALTQTQVSQLYVSIFGRSSEGDGNAYWQSEQSDMTVAANTMLNTEPAKAYFGDTLNDNQMFIEFIYKNTLGKDYADDPEGVNYWVSELAGGKSKGEVVATLISAAIDPQYAGLPAQDQFLNKVAVSNYTADIIATCPDVNDLSAFVDFISNVTYDSTTVITAKAAVDEQVDATGVLDCDSSHLNLCTVAGACFTADGYWYNDICNSAPLSTCDSIHLNLCTAEGACLKAEGYWYNNTCNSTMESSLCDSTHVDYCTLTTGSYPASTYNHYYRLNMVASGNVFLEVAHDTGYSAVYDNDLNLVTDITKGPIFLAAGEYIIHASYSSFTYGVLSLALP
jgi:hypothetical protein